jgi:signal transduction histidine kinase
MGTAWCSGLRRTSVRGALFRLGRPADAPARIGREDDGPAADVPARRHRYLGRVSKKPRPRLAARLRPGHWVAIDVLAAALLTAVGMISVRPGALGFLTVLAMTAPVAVRRIWPLPVFCVVLAFSAVAPQFDVFRDADLARAMALYPVLVLMPEWLAVGAAVASLATTLLATLAAYQFQVDDAAGPMFSGGLIMTTVGATGIAVRLNRRYVRSQRDQAAERAVAQERLRIARELHDVLAHGMSVITIQAGVARHVFEVRPQETRRALEAIEDTSRSSLTELRQMLTALRAEEAGSTAGAGPVLDPAPSLADLDTLVARASTAGIPVEVRALGRPRPLPPGMELSAYRIIQEALTNVVKHAGSARAEVVLCYQPRSLTIEITDNGGGGRRPGAEADPGHGLLGMRERVAVYGGRLHAGPLPPPESGFQVSAHLPLAEGPA